MKEAFEELYPCADLSLRFETKNRPYYWNTEYHDGYRLLFFWFWQDIWSVFEPVDAFHVYIAASCNPIYFSLL